MSLVWVAGNCGAGKTTICRALRERGQEAFDVDDHELTWWFDKETGEKVIKPSISDGRSPVWHEQHIWKVDRGWVEEVAQQAGERVIFMCGLADNYEELSDLADTTMYLVVRKKVLGRQLLTRETGNFGKDPDEFDFILARHKALKRKYLEMGAIPIDVSRSLGEVVDEIINISQPSIVSAANELQVM